jgi:hypothetical protein
VVILAEHETLKIRGIAVSKVNLLVGSEVNYVRFSNQVDINFIFGGKGDWKYANLQIEAAFTLKTASELFTIKPGVAETLTPLLKLLHTTVTHITVTEDEAISLVFSNGFELSVLSQKKYESWNLTSDDVSIYS